MSGTAPVVAAAKRPTVKPKAPVVRKQQPELKRPLPPPQQTLVMTPAEYEQHVAGVHEDEEPQHFEPMIAAHGHPHGHPHAHHQHQHQHHHGATEFVDQDDGVTPAGRYASLQGITVTGSAPAPEAPSRVIMKLKAPPDSRTAAARAAAQKFKTPLRVGPDGMEYIDQYYSPQLHVGGRGRFGVIGQGPPPAQPIPDKPEDFSYLPPEIVSDHCYGKTPPTAGSSQAAQQVFHGGDIGQYGRGRLVPAHLLPTANLSYHQQAAIYRPSRVGGVTYQTTSRLRVAQQRSPSPLGYRGAGESAFALSDEGLVEGYVDANGMEVVGFDGGQMTGVTVSMMGGGSLIGVDRMPANILDDGDELAETSIDIQ
uniref:Uncharacterized protein n=1 Tax=Plectus sambesii TaxID=2011161 RepID=A0A914WVG2_9BILA